jgi:hypothetical protein
LVEGKPLENTTNDDNYKEHAKGKKVECPSVNQVEHVQTVEEQNSKSCCMGIVLIGIVLMSLFTLL